MTNEVHDTHASRVSWFTEVGAHHLKKSNEKVDPYKQIYVKYANKLYRRPAN